MYHKFVVHMFTDFEKGIICSKEKRRNVAPQTLRNTFQKIRDKAARAIEDLLFLGEKQPKQFNQVIGFTRSGRRLRKTKRKNGASIRPITSETIIKRLERGDRAYLLADYLAKKTGLVDSWEAKKKVEKLDEVEKVTKTIDSQELNKAYPRILIGMLQNQYPCPECWKAGLVFRSRENWFWMHIHGEEKYPEATFCRIGKTLPKEFIKFQLKIEPQTSSIWIKLAELEPGEGYQFYT